MGRVLLGMIAGTVAASAGLMRGNRSPRASSKEELDLRTARGERDRELFPGDREWACSHAAGDVLEIAVGTGRNLEHYPTDARVTGIELSPEMLARTHDRASTVRPDADLREGDAEQLTFDDNSFDTVVCTFSLCSIPDAQRAVREMARVVRPGGKVVLVEHVASPNVVVRAIQWLLHQVTYRLACEHMLRTPRHALAAAGLEPVHLERRKAGIVDRLMATKAAPDDGPPT